MGACTAPGPILLLNADTPNATWLAHRWAPKGHLKELEFEGLKTVNEIEAVANSGKVGSVQTVVVDPINELYGRVLRELSHDAVSPSLPTYLAVQHHVERMCRALVESPHVNTVFVCHDLPVKDEGSGEVERLPATGTQNPTLGRKLSGMVDIVGFTAVISDDDGHRYVAQLVNGKGRRGGDRFDSLVTDVPFRDMNLAEWFSTGPQDAPAAMESEQNDGAESAEEATNE